MGPHTLQASSMEGATRDHGANMRACGHAAKTKTLQAKWMIRGKNEHKNGHCDGDSKKLSHQARLRRVRYSLKNDTGQHLELKGLRRYNNGLRSGQSWQQCFAEKTEPSVTQKTENDTEIVINVSRSFVLNVQYKKLCIERPIQNCLY